MKINKNIIRGISLPISIVNTYILTYTSSLTYKYYWRYVTDFVKCNFAISLYLEFLTKFILFTTYFLRDIYL